MRFIFIYFLITLLSFESLQCSNLIDVDNLDSLFIKVNSLSNDSIKVVKLVEISDKYVQIQLDTSYLLVLRALDLSEELENDYCIAKSLYQLAKVLRYKGDYEKALDFANQSFDLFDKINCDTEKAEVLRIKGNIYKRIGDYKNSVEKLLASLEIYSKINDSLQISFVLNNLGLLFTDMKEYDKSLDYLLRSLEIRRKMTDKDLIVVTLMNIGNVYRDIGNYSVALKYYREAAKLVDDNTSKLRKALLLHNMGIVFQELKQYENAIQYYSRAVDIEEEIGEKDLYLSSTQGLGTMMIMQGNNNEGLKNILKAYNLAKKQGDLYKRKSITNSLMWAYFRLKDYKTSIKYYDELIEINDSLLNKEKIRLVTQIEEQYQAEKRKQQIAFLEKEKEVQELEFIKQQNEAKQKRLQRNFLIVIVVFVIFILILLAKDNKKRKIRNQLLIKQNKKIIDQRTEIVRQNQDLLDSNKTKDKLFQIIAHDLRSPLVSIDSLTQLIPFWVEEQDYESLNKLSATLELSVSNVLSLIDNLLNWALSQQGNFPFKPEKFKLIETLQDAIKIYYPVADLKNINLELKKSKESYVFADKNMFLTIVRNLINNAIKFTREKGDISIGVDYSDKFAEVWVEDNGVGIPESKKDKVFELANGSKRGTKNELGKGLGLFFCKEFAVINKGDVYIESEVKKGTKVTFTVPLFQNNVN